MNLRTTNDSRRVAMRTPLRVMPMQAQNAGVLQNLATTNKAMLEQVAEDTASVIEHPLTALSTMVKNMMFPLLHPIESAKSIVDAIKSDPLDGTIDGVGSVTGTMFVGSVIVEAAAVLAAPFTAGASIEMAAGILSVGETAGWISMGSDVPGIILHEVRGAVAGTASVAVIEGQNAASYAEDEGISLITWKLGDALEERMTPNLGKNAAAILNDVVNCSGVYDPPPAQAAA